MAVRLVVTFTVRPGRAADFLRAWRDRVAEVRREPGCEQYELFQSVDRPDTVVLLERWSTPETLEAHAALNRTRPPVAADLRLGESVVERYQE
jgi:quinol monooxygenase YgiN